MKNVIQMIAIIFSCLLLAPIVSSVTNSENSSDRTKETPIISTDVTLSLKKNRSGEDKGTTQ